MTSATQTALAVGGAGRADILILRGHRVRVDTSSQALVTQRTCGRLSNEPKVLGVERQLQSLSGPAHLEQSASMRARHPRVAHVGATKADVRGHVIRKC